MRASTAWAELGSPQSQTAGHLGEGREGQISAVGQRVFKQTPRPLQHLL